MLYLPKGTGMWVSSFAIPPQDFVTFPLSLSVTHTAELLPRRKG